QIEPGKRRAHGQDAAPHRIEYLRTIGNGSSAEQLDLEAAVRAFLEQLRDDRLRAAERGGGFGIVRLASPGDGSLRARTGDDGRRNTQCQGALDEMPASGVGIRRRRHVSLLMVVRYAD